MSKISESSHTIHNIFTANDRISKYVIIFVQTNSMTVVPISQYYLSLCGRSPAGSNNASIACGLDILHAGYVLFHPCRSHRPSTHRLLLSVCIPNYKDTVRHWPTFRIGKMSAVRGNKS